MNLRLAAPIATWDEAIPMGNGLMGGLLWGQDSTLKLSLDRGDLWDLRRHPTLADKDFNYPAMVRLVKARNGAEMQRLFDDPYDYGAPPTKLPAGRIEIELAAGQKLSRFELNLSNAEGLATAGSQQIRSFFCATKPVCMVWIPGPAPMSWRIVRPSVVDKIGHKVVSENGTGSERWYLNQSPEGREYGIIASTKSTKEGTLFAIHVANAEKGKNPIEDAQKLLFASLKVGYQASLKSHKAWWKEYWNASCVVLPDQAIQKQYLFVQYLYGSASRIGAPPIPLQGVWTADSGNLPPWKGDYHNDLNTQMTYMGYQESGRFEVGKSFFDFQTKLLPAYRSFAKSFFQTPGIQVPGVMALDGSPLTGWPQYAMSPVMGAWIGELFARHWRYTQDRKFLESQAYPWCKELAASLTTLLKPDSAGALVLPLSSSPEIGDNSFEAWVKPNSNFDLMTLRAFFDSLAEMSTELNLPNETTKWLDISHRLGPYHQAEDRTLLVATGQVLKESHRHLSNIVGLYPFSLITREGSADEESMIKSSLKNWDSLGTSGWCGYSFAWMSALKARVGRSEAALRQLEIFTSAFLLRNGFHANGDQSGKGYSGFTYRPFTLEGNMLACAAVHEMLMQSWKREGHESVIRVFPSVSDRWQDVSFEDLRAEGGHRVSAMRIQGRTVLVEITAGRSGTLRLLDNFAGWPLAWNVAPIKREGNEMIFNVKRGDIIAGHRPMRGHT